MKRIFFSTAFALSLVSSYAQTFPDTTFSDLTSQYKITLPNLTEFVGVDVGALWEFEVAVIPFEQLGKMEIKWNYDTTLQAHASELDFEKEMADCSSGYFLNHEGTLPSSEQATAVKKTNYCLASYCRRTEMQGYNMGTSYYSDYVGFKKLNCLIIFRFNYSEHNCLHGYEGEGIKQCEADKKRRRIVIDAFISMVTEQLHFTKVGSK